MIRFEAESHTYTTTDGVVVPSVTQVLGDMSAAEYRFVPRDVMERAAALGTAVHAMIDLEIRRELDEPAMHPDLLPYLGQYREFVQWSGFKCLLSEARVYSARHGFAGTLDLFGEINGELVLIDAKRCARVPVTAGPQTAGYEIALRDCRPDLTCGDVLKIKRYALHMTPINWRLVPFNDPNDKRVFLAALTVRNFKFAHKLT